MTVTTIEPMLVKLHHPAAAPAALLGAAVLAQSPFDADFLTAWNALTSDRMALLIVALCVLVLLLMQWNTMRATAHFGRMVSVNEQNARSLATQTKSQRRQTLISARNAKTLEAVPATLTALAESFQVALSKMDTIHSDVRTMAAATDSGILSLTELFTQSRDGAMEAFGQLLTIVRDMGGKIDMITSQLAERDARADAQKLSNEAVRTELAQVRRSVDAMTALLEQVIARPPDDLAAPPADAGGLSDRPADAEPPPTAKIDSDAGEDAADG